MLQDLPRIARALQAINSYELNRMGIRPSPENQALVDLLKPIPRNKNKTHISPAKQNNRKQPTPDQAVTLTTSATEDTAIACETVDKTAAPLSAFNSCVPSTSCTSLIGPELHPAQNAAR
jgi:hypothetical protein